MSADFTLPDARGLLLRQKIWLALVIAVNAALWIIPSDVVELVARDEHTLLGRYSRTQFTWNLVAFLISIVGCYIDWSRGVAYKRRWFQVIAMLVVLGPTIVVADRLMRTREVEHYVRATAAYRRPASASFTQEFVDKPNAFRSYPRVQPGFPAIACTLTTDSRGYRNKTDFEGYDIVAVGDSFTEGSNVSNEHPWPVRLAEMSGQSVYNLGMSGYDPFHYLESLREVGLGLRPKIVICMIYEGNDFRSTKSDEKRRKPSMSKRLEDYIGRSPFVNGIDRALVNAFGRVGQGVAMKGSEVIDWLPVAVPRGGNEKFYGFEPKQLRDLYQTKDEFAEDKHWINPRGQLEEMNQMCREVGARLILAYAPSKAHVLMPLAAPYLPADAVRNFTAIGLKRELPAGNEFLPTLVQRVSTKEEVVADWCKREGIDFIQLAVPLRNAMADGVQVYYTYDQHWTPPGHEVVAGAIHLGLAGGGMLVTGKN